MKQFLNKYLQFTKSERNGAIVLLFLIFSVASIPYLLPYLSSKDSSLNFENFKSSVDEFTSKQKLIEKSKYQRKKNKSKSYYQKDFSNRKEFDYNNISKSAERQKITPFYFNPNNLPKEKWAEMGFTTRQISTIKNYESKGGKFYTKEDVKKLYCINDETYKILEPFIIIPKEDTLITQSKKKYTDYKNIIVDINTADTSELKKLKGIGKAFSKRIVKYRNSLGGFSSKIQLKEVWGIDDDLYNSIESNISCSPISLKTINVNKVNIDELKKHPYIDFYVARSIVKYRESHGDYTDISEIMNSELVHKDLFKKLKPYLTVE